jgi:hypothetical protein
MYVAQAMKGDAARPYAVVDDRQNVVVRFEDYGKARGKARTLNKREAQAIEKAAPMIWSAAA